MCEEFICVTNILDGDDTKFTVEYYLVTEDERNYGVKAVSYVGDSLRSTDLFILAVSEEEAQRLIGVFCTNHVFPASIPDVIRDMKCMV